MSNYLETAQKALKAGKTVNITPKYVTFESEGAVICGMYVSRSPVMSSVGEGQYYQYLFDTDDGLVKFHLGTATDHEAGEIMKAGSVYHIQYLGKEKLAGNKSVNKFHIEEVIYNE